MWRRRAALAALAWCWTVGVGGAAEKVGLFGDPHALIFHGNQTFTAATLVDGLTGNAEFLLASHPAAPREAYPHELARLLTLGYRKAGFPSPEVNVRLDQQRGQVHVTIEEGPRYTSGEIRLEGDDLTIPLDKLREHLTTKQPEENPDEGEEPDLESPVWRPGKPAPFAEDYSGKLATKVERALGDLGYSFAKFEVEVAPDEATQTGVLVIRVRDEGPPGRLGEIVVTGTQKNTPAEVIDYLGLEPGMAFNRARKVQVERDLWRCGRFLASKVTLHPPGRRERSARLEIELKDLSAAPPLNEPLGEKEAALLRLAVWLNAMDQHDGEWLLTGRNEQTGREWLRFAFSNSETAAMFDSPEWNVYPRLHYGLSARSGSVFLFALDGGMRLRLPAEHLQVIFKLKLKPSVKEEDRGEKAILMAGLGWKHGLDYRTAFTPQLKIEPVCALALAHREHAEVTIRDGVATVAENHLRFKFEAATGKLIELVISGEPVHLALRSQPGAVEQTRKQLLAAAPNERRFDPDHPLSGLLAFFVESWLQGEQDEAGPAARLAGKLLAAIERLDIFHEDEDEGWFHIPRPAKGSARAPKTFAQRAAWLTVPWANSLFAYNSWPWTLARESVFVVCKRSRYTNRELSRLYGEDRMGPLGYWATARLTRFVSPKLAKLFAAAGLKRLNMESFHRDAVLIVENDRLLGDVAREAARLLGELEEDELALLARGRPAAFGAALRACAATARRSRDQTDREQVRRVLDTLWKSYLREAAERDLSRLAK